MGWLSPNSAIMVDISCGMQQCDGCDKRMFLVNSFGEGVREIDLCDECLLSLYEKHLEKRISSIRFESDIHTSTL